MGDDEKKTKNNSKKSLYLNSDNKSISEKSLSKYLKNDTFANYNELILQGEQLFMTALKILQKSVRSVTEVKILIDYLKSLPEFTNMMKIVLENSHDLLFNVASALKYEKIPSDRVVIKFGEKGKKFYIVLKGRCSVLLPKEETLNLTQEDYYNYILRLKKFNEKEMLNKVLTQNKNLYPLEEEEFAWLRGDIKTLKGKKNLTPFENYIFKFAGEECIEEIENLDFDIWTIFEKENYVFNSSKYEQKIIDADDYLNKLTPYSSVSKGKEGKPVIIWVYYNIHTLKPGDKFGDLALMSATQKRSATIVSDSECHFGILDKKSFVKCLKSISDKAKLKNVNFILSQKIFQDININIFQKNYFNQFVNKKINIGEYLINEGEQADKIFIIKEGEYKVTIKASNLELFKLIKKLDSNCDMLNKDFDLTNESKEYVDYMYKSNNSTIEIIKDNDIIGLDDTLLDGKCIISVKLISSKGEIFELQKKFFEGMLKVNEQIRKKNREFCVMRRCYWAERLKIIIQSRINFFSTFKSQNNLSKNELQSEKNRIIKETELKNLQLKNKIVINSTNCKSIFDSNLNSLNEKEHIFKEVKIHKNNSNLQADEISRMIYERALKQHPDEIRKKKIEDLKNKYKIKNAPNTISKEDCELKNHGLIQEKDTENQSLYKPVKNNDFAENNNIGKKKNFELNFQNTNNIDNDKNFFKTSFNLNNYSQKLDDISKSNYFEIGKFNKNPGELKKEILNNLLYTTTSSKIFKRQNIKNLNDIYHTNSAQANNKKENSTLSKLNFIDCKNDNQINKINKSYKSFKENESKADNIIEDERHKYLTSIGKEKINKIPVHVSITDTDYRLDLALEENPSKIYLINNSLEKEKVKIKDYEAPIFIGVNVLKKDYGNESEKKFNKKLIKANLHTLSLNSKKIAKRNNFNYSRVSHNLDLKNFVIVNEDKSKINTYIENKAKTKYFYSEKNRENKNSIYDTYKMDKKNCRINSALKTNLITSDVNISPRKDIFNSFLKSYDMYKFNFNTSEDLRFNKEFKKNESFDNSKNFKRAEEEELENLISSNNSFKDSRQNLFSNMNDKNNEMNNFVSQQDDLKLDDSKCDSNNNVNFDAMPEIFEYSNIKKKNTTKLNSIKKMNRLWFKNTIISNSKSLMNRTDSKIFNELHNINKEEKKQSLNIKIINDENELNNNFSNDKNNLNNIEPVNTNLKNNREDLDLLTNINPIKKNSSTSVDLICPKINNNSIKSISTDILSQSNLENEICYKERKMYLIDELDKITQSTKYNDYSKKQNLERLIYQKIFSGILDSNKIIDDNRIKERYKFKNDKLFIDCLAVDKFNEIYSKSYKKTIGITGEEDLDLNLNCRIPKTDLSRSIKNNVLLKNNQFTKSTYDSTFFNKPLCNNKFTDSNKIKSNYTSRFLMEEKARKIYQPRKVVSILTFNSKFIN